MGSDAGRYLIKEMPADERPREKMVEKGPSYLSNPELMAILLRTGNKDMSAIELASHIINHGGDGIEKLADITIEELQSFNGIGVAKASEIMAALELGKRVFKSSAKKKVAILSPKDISQYYMDELRFFNKEKFKILLLNTKSEILKDIDISVGTLNSSLVHPREVFREAIKRSASRIILVHNHPSGNPTPSGEDKNITKRLMDAGRIIGIEVIDHIIFGDNRYYSFKENCLI